MTEPNQASNSSRGQPGGRGWRFGRGRGRGRGCGKGHQGRLPNGSHQAGDEKQTEMGKEGSNHRGRKTWRGRGSKRNVNDDNKDPAASKSNAFAPRGRRAKKQNAPTLPEKTSNKMPPLLSILPIEAVEDPKDKPTTSAPKDPKASKELIVKPRPEPKEPELSAFQRLPGEIRWKIYGYVFGTYRVDIRRLKDTDTSQNTFKANYRLYHRQLRPRTKNQCDPPRPAACTKLPPLPLGLIFSCKGMYRDTILILYTNTQFIFHSTRAVTRFLKTTSKDAQSVINHVELNHIMYHEPHLTEFRQFKIRSDMAWYLACEDLSLKLTSLRVLHINQTIWDWPIRLQIGELWSLPLLFFKELDFANVNLLMSMFKKEKLGDVAKLLEERIMKAEAYQIREDERLARELNGPVRAKVLKLVF